MTAKKRAAESWLAGAMVAFLERGGTPDVLLGTPLFKNDCDVLLEALDILEWHEAAGRVRAWLRKNQGKIVDNTWLRKDSRRKVGHADS